MTEAAVNDQSPADDAEPSTGGPGADLAAYTRVYEEHNARLTAYARTLTGNPSTAEDLVAEAHFRVWRRIAAGHPVENIPAYLATTIRNLANTLHRATTEIPLPTESAEAEFGRPHQGAGTDDLSQQVAHVDFITRLLKDLPERWVRALWLSEVEDLPLEAVGQRIGANSNATAVLLNRAREGLRQAFLRGYPGAPADEACAKHWQKMPSLVRGGLSARQTDSLRAHAEQCDDCRARLAALQQVNLRLPVLLGPALLLLGLGGGAGRWLVAGAVGAKAGGAVGAKVGGAATAGGTKATGTAGAVGAKAGGAGAIGGAKIGVKAGSARHLRHVGGKLRHGVSNGAGKAAAVSAGVVGTTAIAVAAVALTGGAAHPSTAPQAPVETQPAKTTAPVAKTTPSKPAPKPSTPAPAPVTVPPQQPVAPAQYTPRHAAPKPAAPPPTHAAAAAAPPQPVPAQSAPVPAAAAQAPVTPQPTPAATQPPATQPPATPAPTSTPSAPAPISSTPPTPTPPPSTKPTKPSKPDPDIDVVIDVGPEHQVTVTVHVGHDTHQPPAANGTSGRSASGAHSESH